MADPASLTLGLAPIVAGMVKSYKVVYNKLKLFCRAAREVDRIRKQLDRQRLVFTNEIHLLLRIVLDDEKDIEDMVSNGDHHRWKSFDLSDALRSCLARSYGAFTDIVDEISVNTAYLLEELESFGSLLKKEQETAQGRREKLQDSVLQIRSRTKVAFDKTKCDSAIQGLRIANDDMKRLREQVCDLQPRKPGADSTCSANLERKLRPGYACCSKIRRAAQALHQALSNNLPSHQHDVRLFLQAAVAEENAITHLALLCSNRDRPIRGVVQVRSCPVEWLPTPSPSPESSMERLRVSEEPSKRRKVQWQNQQAQTLARVSSGSTRPGQRKENGPQATHNLCVELCHRIPSHGKRKKDGYLCYVETVVNEAFRHEFYPQDSQYQCIKEVATFDKILDHPVETAITMVDQLKLARTIVSAVLYFSSTSWLAEYWGMKDLCYFPDNNGDLSDSLRTVNIGVTFSGKEPAPCQTTMMEGLITPPLSQDLGSTIQEAMLRYGIRNMALHNLGVVLLQLGRWQRVESDDIIRVRRLAEEVPRLGRRYRELTQKCLYCNFRGGNKLSRPQLQQDVYEEVVEVLDEMIESLDLHVDETS